MKKIIFLGFILALSHSTVNADIAFAENDITPSRSGNSQFAFLLLARKALKITQFRKRNSDVESVQYLSSGRSNEKKTTHIRQYGGSSLRKADIVEYDVTSSEDINATLSEVLSSSGIEPIRYSEVGALGGGPGTDAIMKEFRNKDAMSDNTWVKVVSAARECKMNYLSTGTIDIGVHDIDPVSGDKRVFVSVRAQVYEIGPRFTKMVASVGPVQYSGLGPDESVAGRNAIIIAARETGLNIVHQLDMKGIR